MKNIFVFDIETDGLYDEVSKIHCLSYNRVGTDEVKSITDYETIKRFFSQEDLTLIGHNIITYDIPVIEKVLGIEVNAKRVVDTLGISWYLNSSADRSFRHGLEHYGEKFGVKKPEVDDWENLTIEEYVHRCEEDVKINSLLWNLQQKQLLEVYDRDGKEVLRIIDYITDKLDVIAEKQVNRILLDVNLIKYEINRLTTLSEERRKELLEVMPKRAVKSKRKKPKVMYKANGELSSHGKRWLEFLMDNDLPEDTEGEVEYISEYVEPNPDSNTQIKDWLFSLGWVPEHFKYVRNKDTNDFRKVPQITNEFDSTELCPSVKKLTEKVPEIVALEGYSTINHRIALYEGFLRDMDSEGRIQWDMAGFTNTFRLKHRKVVNLPNARAPFAENVRRVFIAEEGGYLAGADLKNIEDLTKRSYIKPLDPEYVETMMADDYDGHLEIAVRAGLLTEEQAEAHKKGEADYSEERTQAKMVNFSATYGVGVKTLARSMGVSESVAKPILDAYWKRNWAVEKFSESCRIKTIGTQMWVQQPVSKFWYTLRSTKDVFSTVNQSTAVYVFDMWVKELRKNGNKISGTVHDELIIKEMWDNRSQEEVTESFRKAMDTVNSTLGLELEVGFDIDFGRTYLDIH